MSITYDDISSAYLDALRGGNNYVKEKFIYNIFGKFGYFCPSLGKIPVRFGFTINNDKYKIVEDDIYWSLNETLDWDKTNSKLMNIPNTILFQPDCEMRFLISDNFAWDSREAELYVINQEGLDAVLNCIVTIEEKATVGYISSISQHGAQITNKVIKQVKNSEILCNYNEDLPNQEVLDFLKSDESGLVVYRSQAGCGKTYYIRSLINELRDIEFLTLDVSDFAAFISNKQCFNNMENKVLIIEDCEELLKDRNQSSFHTGISTLLNITDGLFGDFLNFKIICTFNSDLRNLDKALFRKGRIKIFYEFKPLSKDRADTLRKKLGKVEGDSNILCDIYNSDSTGVTDQQQTKKIGF